MLFFCSSDFTNGVQRFQEVEDEMPIVEGQTPRGQICQIPLDGLEVMQMVDTIVGNPPSPHTKLLMC